MSPNAELRALFKSMRRIARAVELHSRRLDRELGMTLSQHVVLACVRDLGEVTSRAISAEADVSPATMVGILDKLEAKGLIERYRSTRDRRIVHTKITAKGQAALARAPSPLGARFEAGFLRLDADSRAQTVAAFERVAHLAGIPEPGEVDEAAGRGRP
ncbi:MAG TPA: MarR family transcriptional regulator [Paracoccaceae bacterium]|nr:MarR family transcriptional regulator [Paracoccaceae bacterium]